MLGAYSTLIYPPKTDPTPPQWKDYTNRTVTFDADLYSYITVCCKVADLGNFYLIDNTNSLVLFKGKDVVF